MIGKQLMSANIFIDSNIWLYSLLYDDVTKHIGSLDFIQNAFTSSQVIISTQVINEVCSNLVKNKFSEEKSARQGKFQNYRFCT